jgi:hypothetical protein
MLLIVVSHGIRRQRIYIFTIPRTPYHRCHSIPRIAKERFAPFTGVLYTVEELDARRGLQIEHVHVQTQIGVGVGDILSLGF